jgi:hypothetical protein
MTFPAFVRITSAIVACATAVGCFIPNDESDLPKPQTTVPTAPGNIGAVTAIIDTDKTMNATGGDGVGVFVEYSAGGHWHIWLTCDTRRTSRECAFNLTLPWAPAGRFAKPVVLSDGVATTEFAGSFGVAGYALTGRVGRDVVTIDMDGDPGKSLLLKASVDGSAAPQYFFFVQDGKVNGGFPGKLTNPAIFQPSTP